MLYILKIFFFKNLKISHIFISQKILIEYLKINISFLYND